MPSLLCSSASCHFFPVLLFRPPAPPCTRRRCPGPLGALGLFSPSFPERSASTASPAEPSHAPLLHGLPPVLFTAPLAFPGLRVAVSKTRHILLPEAPGVAPIVPSVVSPLNTLMSVTMTPSSQMPLTAGCHPVRVEDSACLLVSLSPPAFHMVAQIVLLNSAA